MKGTVWKVERINREAGFQPWFDMTIRIVPENASEYPTFTVDEPVRIDIATAIWEEAYYQERTKTFNLRCALKAVE